MLLAGPRDLPPRSRHGCKQAPHELQLPWADCMPFVRCCMVDMVTWWTPWWLSCAAKCLPIVDRVVIMWARLSSGHTRCFCRRRHVGAHLQTPQQRLLFSANTFRDYWCFRGLSGAEGSRPVEKLLKDVGFHSIFVLLFLFCFVFKIAKSHLKPHHVIDFSQTFFILYKKMRYQINLSNFIT